MGAVQASISDNKPSPEERLARFKKFLQEVELEKEIPQMHTNSLNTKEKHVAKQKEEKVGFIFTLTGLLIAAAVKGASMAGAAVAVKVAAAVGTGLAAAKAGTAAAWGVGAAT